MSVSKITKRSATPVSRAAAEPTENAANHSAELADEARKWTQPPVVRRDESAVPGRRSADANVRYDLD